MKITFLYNSGFAVECGDTLIVLDYFKDVCDGPRSIENGVITDGFLERFSRVYVLASHSHPDHFNSVTLAWQKQHDEVIYVLGYDIERSIQEVKDAHFLRPGQEYRDEKIFVKAFGSTDMGVSFYFEIGGKSLFHAGDLNLWHWKSESTASQVMAATAAFDAEISRLKAYSGSVGVAFFPVDSRLGVDFYDGALRFMETINTGLFIPMHFFQDFEAPKIFAADERVGDKRLWVPKSRGAEVEV